MHEDTELAIVTLRPSRNDHAYTHCSGESHCCCTVACMQFCRHDSALHVRALHVGASDSNRTHVSQKLPWARTKARRLSGLSSSRHATCSRGKKADTTAML